MHRQIPSQTLEHDGVDAGADADEKGGALCIGRHDSYDSDLTDTGVLVCASVQKDKCKFGRVGSRAYVAFAS